MRLKRRYSIVAHSPDVVELRHGVWNPTAFTLRDDQQSGILYRVIRHLRSDTTAAQIAKLENVPLNDVEGITDRLTELGALQSTASNAFDYYLDCLAPTLLQGPVHDVKRLPVSVLGDAVVTQEIESALGLWQKDAPIELLQDGAAAWGTALAGPEDWTENALAFRKHLAGLESWRGRFIVHALKTIQPQQFRFLNRIALALNFPWLHASIDGPFLYVGPLCIPHETACYECFETRVLMNLREAASYQDYKSAIAERKVAIGDVPTDPVVTRLFGCHVALETINFACTKTSFTVGKALAIYLPTMEFSYNEVLRLPGCPACSPSHERDGTELYFDMRTVIPK